MPILERVRLDLKWSQVPISRRVQGSLRSSLPEKPRPSRIDHVALRQDRVPWHVRAAALDRGTPRCATRGGIRTSERPSCCVHTWPIPLPSICPRPSSPTSLSCRSAVHGWEHRRASSSWAARVMPLCFDESHLADRLHHNSARLTTARSSPSDDCTAPAPCPPGLRLPHRRNLAADSN